MVRVKQAWFGALLGAVMLALPGTARGAGGAFVVDDYAIDEVGECNVETWASFARNGDFNAVTSPSCVVRLGFPVEISADLQRQRQNKEWMSKGALAGKVTLLPMTNGIGVGFSAQVNWNQLTGEMTGGNFLVPVTFEVTSDLRFHLNAGGLRDTPTNANYFTYGAAIEYDVVKNVQLIGEVYGQHGPANPEQPGINDLRFQAGIRVTPLPDVDIDLIYGHNIDGERAQWVTLGFNLRFDTRR